MDWLCDHHAGYVTLIGYVTAGRLCDLHGLVMSPPCWLCDLDRLCDLHVGYVSLISYVTSMTDWLLCDHQVGYVTLIGYVTSMLVM